MKSITHELAEPLMYSNGSGSEIEGSFITIKEPTGKIAHLTGILRTEIGVATRNAFKGMESTIKVVESKDSSDDDDDDSPEGRGEAHYTMLTMGGADMGRVMVTMKEILRNSADVGGEKAMTSGMWDKLPESECVRILKAYIGNFIQA